MDFGAQAAWLVIPVQIFFVDLMLGADNALLIALACRSLGPEDTRRAIALGAGGAIALRLALTLLASSLLALPLVKLAGAWLLIVIALNVTAAPKSDASENRAFALGHGDLWSVATTIVVADAAMSLDNVVAIAAIARGNFWLLAAGVACSIPVLAYGGLILTTLLENAPALVAIGAALLGWIAGDMAASDPLIADWADVNAPGLVAIAPALGAAFVFLRGGASAGRPAPPPAPPPAAKPTAPAALFPRPPRARAPKFAPSSREDRVAVIGVLILAAIAGLTLLVVSYLDSPN
ncbi:MAG: YjbE family putative metal transport protein [Roseiarcus sp.]|jgi:YjbE family integral membrane protein